MTNNLVGNGGKTYSSNSKLVESARCCLLWQLILFQVVIKPSSYLIFKVYKILAYLVHGSSFGRNVHWRNFIELIIFYIKLLKYTFLSLNIHSVQNTYILTIQLGLIHQRKIFELFTIYPVYIYHEVVEYLVFHAIHDRIIKPFCSHTSFVMHKYTRFCAVVNALQPFAHHS